jgi:hypothetical protein
MVVLAVAAAGTEGMALTDTVVDVAEIHALSVLLLTKIV